MNTLELTRQGLVRALSAGIARSARVDAALRARAEDVGSGRSGDTAGVVRHGPGRYSVEAEDASDLPPAER